MLAETESERQGSLTPNRRGLALVVKAIFVQCIPTAWGSLSGQHSIFCSNPFLVDYRSSLISSGAKEPRKQIAQHYLR